MPDAATPPADVAAALPAAEDLLVLIDFDGTLSAIVDDPDAARPVPGALDAVRALSTRCHVAIVSGRHLDDLRARIGEPLPVTLSGGHGTAVERPDGTVEALVDPADVAGTLDPLEADLDALLPAADGWIVERKPTSIAVHYRRVAHPGPLLDAVHDRFARAAADPPGFDVLDGKMVTELRPAGFDKGGVVDRLADEHPGRTVVMLGDDVTDEDAFRAAVARDGVAVLVAEEPRPTLARWRVASPDEVVSLLRLLSAPNLSHSS